ncbi:hypothetical protein DXC11_07600 [Firmicutes bacterium OM08-11AC]|nr:hypothetical protein DXC11_07600 [Firmicutes bacterium OM08-11AC]
MIGVISTNKVDFPFWDDEGKKAITEIYRVKNQMQNVGVRLKTNDISNEDFSVFLNNVYETLKYWTGHTYIGQEKDKALQKAYQTFFEALYKFLFICREFGNPMLKSFSDEVLYRGSLYRYLGKGSVEENTDKRIEPQYDNIYVSWSKQPKNYYIESKLYGTMTLLTCKIDEPYYGIDLEAFGVVRGEEAEVVFPTIKETITEVKYIRE